MKLTALIFLALSFAISPTKAAYLDGIKVSGEASFDYSFLSSKENTIPAMGAATNEAYRLNQVQLVAEKETEQISFIARILYYPTVYVAQSSPSETKTVSNLGPLDQLEIYYKITPQLSVGFGRLYTTMGYESFLRSENPTYGNSIASQTIVPTNGEGVRIKYVATDLFTATVSSYNQYAYYSSGSSSATPTKTTEVSATGTTGNLTLFASYHWGKTAAATPSSALINRSASSVWASYKITDKFMTALTYDSKMSQPDGTHWADATGLVMTYGLGMNNLAVRYEMVRGAMELADSATGKTYGNADKVNSLTFADKITMNDNFHIFVEYRMDQADEDVFLNENGVGKKDVILATVGAVAHF